MTVERAAEVTGSGSARPSRRGEPVPAAARRSPAWSWRRQPNLADNLIGLSLLAAPANVIMQLSWPGVGYGVVDSKVDSGRADLHPVKRLRTTATYLAVATWGTPEQKAAYRKAVNVSHAQVRSQPADAVQYNAFDPELQKWVAICLYKGFVDVYEAFIGPLTGEMAQQCLREGATMGTTLQMPLEMWPSTLAEYENYWRESMDKVHIDDHVHGYLYDLASAKIAAPRFARAVVGPISRLITTGFLPPRFRAEMRLPWSPARERIFRALLKALALLNRTLPNGIRQMPYNLFLRDLDWRMRTGRPLV